MILVLNMQCEDSVTKIHLTPTLKKPSGRSLLPIMRKHGVRDENRQHVSRGRASGTAPHMIQHRCLVPGASPPADVLQQRSINRGRKWYVYI